MRRTISMRADDRVVEADEIRVGGLVITRAEDGTGLWIGNGVVTPCVAIWHMPEGNVGVGVYPPGTGPVPGVCLGVGEDGSGLIQFGSGDRVVNLTFDMVQKLAKLLEGK